MDDIAIPIVFPAYLIAVPRPGVDLPAFMNTWGIQDIKPKTERVPDLGHAGILFIRGSDGLTKYYEYGRYDDANLGLVRRRRIPDLSSLRNKDLTAALVPVLAAISKEAGQGGRVKGVIISVPGKFSAMMDFAEKRLSENSNPTRKPYELLSNNCMDFGREVVKAAGVDMPYQIDPRPLNYMQKLEENYQSVAYDPRTRRVSLGKK
jgi:hypothetical protein